MTLGPGCVAMENGLSHHPYCYNSPPLPVCHLLAAGRVARLLLCPLKKKKKKLSIVHFSFPLFEARGQFYIYIYISSRLPALNNEVHCVSRFPWSETIFLTALQTRKLSVGGVNRHCNTNAHQPWHSMLPYSEVFQYRSASAPLPVIQAVLLSC